MLYNKLIKAPKRMLRLKNYRYFSPLHFKSNILTISRSYLSCIFWLLTVRSTFMTIFKLTTCLTLHQTHPIMIPWLWVLCNWNSSVPLLMAEIPEQARWKTRQWIRHYSPHAAHIKTVYCILVGTVHTDNHSTVVHVGYDVLNLYNSSKQFHNVWNQSCSNVMTNAMPHTYHLYVTLM